MPSWPRSRGETRRAGGRGDAAARGGRGAGRRIAPPLRPPDRARLSDCVISLALPWRGWRRREGALRRATRVSRVLGSSALSLAYVANGRFDVFVQARPLSSWDVAAGGLIAEEAGAGGG